MSNLSTFIITKNDEKYISKSILSIKNIADEIIVIDQGSIDRTAKIASELGAKVYFDNLPPLARVKAYAESLCRNDWVLNINASEELSKELQDEIDHIFLSSNLYRYIAYSAQLACQKGSKLRYPSNKNIRIYNRQFASFFNAWRCGSSDCVIFNEGIDYKNKIYKLNAAVYKKLLSNH